MAPGSCVHASSWTIDFSVDPENFHPDDLQQCVSPPDHLNHSFPVSSLGNSIPCWGLLSAKYLRASASVVRPKLQGSVCHKREVGSLSYTSSVTEHILGFVTWKEVPRMDVTSLTNFYHLLYSGLILQNFLPTQGGESSRRHLLEEEIFYPNFGAASSPLPSQN